MQTASVGNHRYAQCHAVLTHKPNTFSHTVSLCILALLLRLHSCATFVHAPFFTVAKQGSNLCVPPFSHSPSPLRRQEGSDSEKGEEEEAVGRGAFHRHAKTFRGKPSQIFPTVCGEGFASPVAHTRFEKVLKANTHTLGESVSHTQHRSPSQSLRRTHVESQWVQL